MRLAHDLRQVLDEEPTLRLDEPITHARALLRALDEADLRPTVAPAAPSQGRRSRKRKP